MLALLTAFAFAPALDLSEKQAEFAAKGVKLIGVVHEKLGVEEFSTFFKNGEIYFDEEKSFFNGETLWGFVCLKGALSTGRILSKKHTFCSYSA